ncbi:hypothetical protein V8E36_004230 [Tilletia maclaganii]
MAHTTRVFIRSTSSLLCPAFVKALIANSTEAGPSTASATPRHHQAREHAMYDIIVPIAGALFPPGSRSPTGVVISTLSMSAVLVLKSMLQIVVDQEEAAELNRDTRCCSENGARSQRRRRGPVHLELEGAVFAC